ncbi:hypothetical protein [Nocardioides sp. AE5]|uniref:hypothetical protein n=1 Tax=Nocardioides sp. AE5 TaxID=2962573 RepID=UPI00288193C7|nr:hypothetical protein [Nocardioides sp. AE5]MDT0200334.1 hypothetical protein [Nocardioides sp. AE5]
MSDAKKLPRPPQVTLSGWVAIVGSVFVVFNAFSVVANLRSIENRERLSETLSRDPLKSTGITLEQALEVMHVSALVSGACGAAAAILGIFVLQRHHQARIALSVVVFPLVIAGMVTGDLLSPMVAVCAALLWTRPARDWFNGIAPTPPERRTPPPPRQEPPRREAPDVPPTPPITGGTSDEPRPYSGFGTPSGAVADPERPAAEAGPAPAYPGPYPYAAQPAPRPGDVLRACLATWLTSSIVLVGCLVAVIGFATWPDAVREMVESEPMLAEAGLSAHDVRVASIVMAILFGLWALGAMGLAIFTMMGHNWARVLLICSAACAGLLCLLMALSAPMVLVFGAAAAYTIYALSVKPVAAWFRERSAARKVR